MRVVFPAGGLIRALPLPVALSVLMLSQRSVRRRQGDPFQVREGPWPLELRIAPLVAVVTASPLTRVDLES